MNHWQDFIVVGLITVAAIYLARILWFRMTKRANACCDACHGCSSTSAPKDQQDELIPLITSTPTRSASEDEKPSTPTPSASEDEKLSTPTRSASEE
jgi:hypothetical protein